MTFIITIFLLFLIKMSIRLEKDRFIPFSHFIKKLYAIDTVQESYDLDGYMTAKWDDPGILFRKGLSFEGDNIDSVLGTRIWSPSLEFVNRMKERDSPQRTLDFGRDSDPEKPDTGNVKYSERFQGTFWSSAIHFRKHPFDKQIFELLLESFANDNKVLEFALFPNKSARKDGPRCHLDLKKPDIKQLHDSIIEWDLLRICESISETDLGGGAEYSKYTFSIEAERKPAYFVWQFFLPLMLIIASSWVVFFIQDFSSRLNIGFTLLLTVVAFNFYTSTLLPRLPYNTFMETTVISGYVSIFCAILAVVLSHFSEGTRYQSSIERYFSHCRWVFPLAYALSAAFVIWWFLYGIS
jgi:hypothetical protein